ncbi:MAG TPA: pantoate--beta-alanine ligase, partial [Oceanospirillales bacterium]|nr:pantoate--beta-alanine ligase [Oceanospirillales bacterium]
MKIIKTIKQFQQYRQQIINADVGLVATMGALHQGHISLIKQATKENHISIVSIFVNPTQFDQKDDLKNYPNQINADIEQLQQAGVDCVFLPEFAEMYPDAYQYKVAENNLSKKYCGAHRDGHFDGVLTVVMKLLNICRPSRAYFGEKDYQQLTLIKNMVSAFFMPVEIVAVATMREKDGLAMSSRNLNLSSEQRKIAPKLYATIRSGQSLKLMQQQLKSYGFKVDYLEILN